MLWSIKRMLYSLSVHVKRWRCSPFGGLSISLMHHWLSVLGLWLHCSPAAAIPSSFWCKNLRLPQCTTVYTWATLISSLAREKRVQCGTWELLTDVSPTKVGRILFSTSNLAVERLQLTDYIILWTLSMLPTVRQLQQRITDWLQHICEAIDRLNCAWMCWGYFNPHRCDPLPKSSPIPQGTPCHRAKQGRSKQVTFISYTLLSKTTTSENSVFSLCASKKKKQNITKKDFLRSFSELREELQMVGSAGPTDF